MAPAERTGATAMRPSFGAIGRSGVMSLVDSLVRAINSLQGQSGEHVSSCQLYQCAHAACTMCCSAACLARL